MAYSFVSIIIMKAFFFYMVIRLANLNRKITKVSHLALIYMLENLGKTEFPVGKLFPQRIQGPKLVPTSPDTHPDKKTVISFLHVGRRSELHDSLVLPREGLYNLYWPHCLVLDGRKPLVRQASLALFWNVVQTIIIWRVIYVEETVDRDRQRGHRSG